MIVVVFSESPAPLTFSVSDLSVASISSSTANSAEIAILGAGSTTFTVTQSATSGYSAGSFSRTLTVGKATQSALTVGAISGTPGRAVSLSATGGTTTGPITFTVTDNGDGACTLTGDQLSRSTAGSCTVTATRAGNDNYEEVTSAPRVIEFANVISGTVNEGGSLTLVAPEGTRFSSVVFASYGTPNGSAGNFTQGGCHASSSASKVAEFALLQRSATIPATNTLFGDPCNGTPKRLYVALAFEPITSTLLYEVTNPKRISNAIQYTSGLGTAAGDAAATFDASGRVITRVIYRMEVEVGGVLRFAEVSFDPWTGLTARGLRVPDLLSENRFTIQRYVENMVVGSNMTSTASAKSTGVITGSGRRGYLEIWPWNYDSAPTAGGPSGNDGYDYNDSPSVDNGEFGSFQVHDVTDPTANRTVMAWNQHGFAASADIGLGNYTRIADRHPDWTFTSNNSLGSTNWKLQIRVESTPPPEPVSFTATDCTPVDTSGTETQDGIPGNERCENAFESPEALTTDWKLYDGTGPFLYWIDLGSAYRLTGFQVWTANDAWERDPAQVKIYASSESKTRLGNPIVDASVSCPPERRSACTPLTFGATSSQRYLVIEIASVRVVGNGFQISRALFTGVPQAASSASTVSTVGEENDTEGTDGESDESVPGEDGVVDDAPSEEFPSDDGGTPDSDDDSGDDVLPTELLVGTLALGARTNGSASGSVKRYRRARRGRSR